MKLRYLIVAACMVWCAAIVAAQTGVVGGVISSGPCCAFAGIKGEPFSADVIQENNQVLADGNRIHQELHGHIYRDSQGRTRNEMELTTIPSGYVHEHITIQDPAQQVMIMLNPQNKTAQVHHYGRAKVRAPQPAAPNATAPQRPQMQTRLEMPKPEKLGTMEIEGFTANGTRMTHTIPAGQMGNDQPIVSVHEAWVSPELHEVLLSKTVDPRSGEHIRKLVNIQRVEPDPALFQIPPDCTVTDDKQR